MKTSSVYIKYLADKEIPIIVIFQALYSVCWRFVNTMKKKGNCVGIEEIIRYVERYGRYEERYPLQISFLDNLLDEYGIREGYYEYKRHVEYTCLTDLMSAQFVTKVINAICKDGASITGIPASGEQRKSDGNHSVTDDYSRLLYYAWTDSISAVDEESGNNLPQIETKLETIDTI